MKILKEIKQPLLSRIKYEILVEHNKEKTPSKNELNEKINSFLKTKTELVDMRSIYTKQGSSQSNVTVYVYDNKQALEDLKPKKKHGKKKKEEQSSK